MSVPGQTMGMAVFTDTFIDALALSRTELATAYFFGTLGSSLLLTRAGRVYDRLGARTMMVVSSVALGLVILFISILDRTAMPIASLLGLSLGWVTFPLILVAYFGVRFAGQGVLTSASRNVLLVWFEKRRGLVSGVRGVFVSIGFSIAPLIIAMMIDGFGWRGALWIMALCVGGVFALLALLFVRDTPEASGLHPDGAPAPVETDTGGPLRRNITLADARRSPVFWIYSLALAMHALFGTAVTFHIVSVFEEVGRGRDEAFGYFLPAAIVSFSANMLFSWLADFSPLKPFLLIMLGAFILGAIGLYNLNHDWGYWTLVVGFGAGGGLWGVLSNLAYIRYFGRRHLGEISGLNMSLSVFASAVGPVLFSVGRDAFGTYRAAELLCIVFLTVLLVAAILIKQEDDTGRTAKPAR